MTNHLVAFSAVLFMLLAPRTGVAEAQPSSRTVVLLLAQGTPTQQKDAAIAAIRSQMADVPVRIVVHETNLPRGDLRATIDLATELARTNAAVGAFWLDLDRESDLLLYLTEPQGSRLLVRRIRSSKGAQGAALEEVALITRYAVSALLEGGQIGMQALPVAPAAAPTPTPPTPTPAPTPPVAPPSLSEPGKVRLGVAYYGEAWSSNFGWQSGVRGLVGFDLGRGLSTGVSYALEPPLVIETARASARIARHPVEAWLGGRFAVGFVALAAELALGVDSQTRSTTTSAAGLTKTPNDTVLMVTISPRVGLARQVLGRAEIFGLVGLDYVVNPTAYVLTSPTRETVASPTRLRPRVDVGVSLAVW